MGIEMGDWPLKVRNWLGPRMVNANAAKNTGAKWPICRLELIPVSVA